jgi:hypothetical protein
MPGQVKTLPDKCSKHPRFSGRCPPRATKAHEQGCPDCWRFHEAISEGDTELDEVVGGNLGIYESVTFTTPKHMRPKCQDK